MMYRRRKRMKYDYSTPGGMLKHMIGRINEEFVNLLNNDKRVIDWIDKNGVDNVYIATKQMTMSRYIQTQLFDHKGHLTYKYVNDVLMQMNSTELYAPFSMTTRYEIKDDKVYVTGCILIIRTGTIASDIALFIHDIENIWKRYQWLLKHEVGHLVDHINHRNGISIKEFQDCKNQTIRDYMNHDKWHAEYKQKPGYNPDTANRHYYNIPSEAAANEAAGIDVDEMIKIDGEYRKMWDNKNISIDINILNVEDKPKNDGKETNNDVDIKEKKT